MPAGGTSLRPKPPPAGEGLAKGVADDLGGFGGFLDGFGGFLEGLGVEVGAGVSVAEAGPDVSVAEVGLEPGLTSDMHAASAVATASQTTRTEAPRRHWGCGRREGTAVSAPISPRSVVCAASNLVSIHHLAPTLGAVAMLEPATHLVTRQASCVDRATPTP